MKLDLSKIPDDELKDKIKELVAEGLMEMKQAPDGHFEYRVSEEGAKQCKEMIKKNRTG